MGDVDGAGKAGEAMGKRKESNEPSMAIRKTLKGKRERKSSVDLE
jgi:hypothetical protein